jgi:NAD(P)-dependent dehydrogenase (short-subunit alcohol dehydrogenase family)
MFNFEGQVAFVTGGASGIGFGIATALAERGVKLALADINQEQLANAIHDLGVGTLGILLDVTDREGWAEAEKQVEAALGPVGILIQCAGIMDAPGAPMPTRGLVDYSYEKWDRMLGISLTGIANGIMVFGPGMRDRRSGHIVNTASTQGLIPTAGVAAYSAAKFGVVALSEATRDELSHWDVGVSVLCPGVVSTGLAANAVKAAGGALPDGFKMPGLDPAAVGEMVIAAIKDNRPYIFTHGEYRKPCEDRFTRISAAFTEVPVSADFDPATPLAGTREWANDPTQWVGV